jgi:hypothetical protein
MFNSDQVIEMYLPHGITDGLAIALTALLGH